MESAACNELGYDYDLLMIAHSSKKLALRKKEKIT